MAKWAGSTRNSVRRARGDHGRGRARRPGGGGAARYAGLMGRPGHSPDRRRAVPVLPGIDVVGLPAGAGLHGLSAAARCRPGSGGGADVIGVDLHRLIAEATAERCGAIDATRARKRQLPLSAQPFAGAIALSCASAVALRVLSAPHFNTSWAAHS